jgi:hypothetical protein
MLLRRKVLSIVTIAMIFASSVATAQLHIKAEGEWEAIYKTSNSVIESAQFEFEYEAEEGGLGFCHQERFHLDLINWCDITVDIEISFAPNSITHVGTYSSGLPYEQERYQGLASYTTTINFSPPCGPNGQGGTIVQSTTSDVTFYDYTHDELYGDMIFGPTCNVLNIPLQISTD